MITVLLIIGQVVLVLIFVAVSWALVWESLHSHNRYDLSTPNFHIPQVPRVPPEILNFTRPLKFDPFENNLN
jgi:hypothetical protein